VNRARSIAVLISIGLISGCSTRGNLTPRELTSLREQLRVLEVQEERCSNFGAYAGSELFKAIDEDRTACAAKCSALPFDPKSEAAIPDACFRLFPECRSPIFDQVKHRLDEENPNPPKSQDSVLKDNIDTVEPEPPQSRCDYSTEKIERLQSRLYYGDPANCSGPCWMY